MTILTAEEVFAILQDDPAAGSGGRVKEALGALVGLVKEERASRDARELDASAFVSVSRRCRTVDVRSPGEFRKGHIPGAVNVPLFDDDERAVVGTKYKRSGREAAMCEGMKFVAEKGLSDFAERVLRGDNDVCIYCWRGGLRSGAVAWLCRRLRPDARTSCLVGGYRSFRRWARAVWSSPSGLLTTDDDDKEDPSSGGSKKNNNFFPIDECVDDASLAKKQLNNALPKEERQPPGGGVGVAVEDSAVEDSSVANNTLVVVAGRTGVGKTKVLLALKTMGEQVVDLEGFANHRGSAFGYVAPQPTNEDFENRLALYWRDLDPRKRIFVEDEEGHVGKCLVPKGLYEKMRRAKVVVRLAASIDLRVTLLVDDYVDEDDDALVDRLVDTTTRLGKRIGTDNAAKAVRLLRNDDGCGKKEKNKRDFHAFAKLMLTLYYDKLYDKHVANRITSESCTVLDLDVRTHTELPSTRQKQQQQQQQETLDATATAKAVLDAVVRWEEELTSSAK